MLEYCRYFPKQKQNLDRKKKEWHHQFWRNAFSTLTLEFPSVDRITERECWNYACNIEKEIK